MNLAAGPATNSRFRVLGVEINIHLSWLAIALLIAWSLATGAFPSLYAGLPRSTYWVMAVIVVVGLAVSIVLHELAHTLVGRAFGMSIERITLFLFGGVAELRDEPKAPLAELLMALAGPAVSVVVSLAFSLSAEALSGPGGSKELAAALGYLATLNMVLAIFNMAPAYPMDGGRVLRAAIWMATGNPERATRIAARAGQAFSVLLMLAGVLIALQGQLVGGLWWVLIGLFLRMAATSTLKDITARRLLGGHSISEIMSRRIETAPGDMLIDGFITDRLYASHHGMYPVLAQDRLLGVVEPADILKTPRDRWADTTLADVCTPLDRVSSARPDEDAFAVLERMRSQRRTHILILDRRRLVGMVTLQDLLERLALAAAFEPPAASPTSHPKEHRYGL